MSDFARYHRQTLLRGFGTHGQQRLADATVAIVGCGALGSVAADMLARAGVGHLVVIDRDFVELTNLQRQVLFDESDVAAALPKAEAARRKLAAINSGVRVSAIIDDVNDANIAQYADGADLIVDGLDNFETRYLVNDYAVRAAVPWVYGAAVGTTGMSIPVLPHSAGTSPWEGGAQGSLATPCLRCLFEEPPEPGSSPTCDTVGVLGSAVAIVANHQVAEALKILTGAYDRLNRRLLSFDLWANDWQWLDVDAARSRGDCPCCKRRRFDYLDGRAGSTAATLCGREAVQLRRRDTEPPPDLGAIADRLGGSATVNEFMLRAALEDHGHEYELTLFADGRAIVKGTTDGRIARGIYARYVGG